MSKGYTTHGKQVIDPRGEHFADACSPVAALLIVCVLELRKHRPAIDGDRVICSRCQSELPHEGDEPCVPRTPRCTKTLDMFDEEPASQDGSSLPDVQRRAS